MRIALSLFAIAGLVSCAGKAPPDPGVTPDAGGDDGDGGITALMLSGKVLDYFGGQAVDGAEITTDGLEPPLTTTSALDGYYQLDVAVGSSLFLVASKPNYRPTRNMAVTVGDEPMMYDAYVMTDQDVKNQYTAVGATPALGTAILIADLRRNNGMPLEGVLLADVQLLDGNNQPVPDVLGPYFFNAAGSIDALQETSVAANGRARVAFLDVPPGTHTLSVSYLDDNEQTKTNTTTVATLADGATLALSGGMGGGGGGGGGGMGGGNGGGNVTDPSFAMHIYPKLQRAGEGGLGCANCHTLTGPAAVLKYDDPPGVVLASITARPGVVNAAAPAESLLLVRPLYEPPPTPQDHPNATFLDTNDPDYQLFLLWITNGAKP